MSTWVSLERFKNQYPPSRLDAFCNSWMQQLSHFLSNYLPFCYFQKYEFIPEFSRLYLLRIYNLRKVFVAQLKNVFISCKGHVSILKCLVFCILNYSIDFESCEIIRTNSTRGGVCCWKYLFNGKALGHKIGRIKDIVTVQYF